MQPNEVPIACDQTNERPQRGRRLKRTIPSIVALEGSPSFVKSCTFLGAGGPRVEGSKPAGMELLFDGARGSELRVPRPPSQECIEGSRRAQKGRPNLIIDASLSKSSVEQGVVALRFAKLLKNQQLGPSATVSEAFADDDDSDEDEEHSEPTSGDSNECANSVSPWAARAEETILKQQTERFHLACHYQHLRQSMRPPPPMSIDELERHPLNKYTTSDSCAKKSSTALGESEGSAPPERTHQLSKEHLETFSPKTREIEVKRYLLRELSWAESAVNHQKVIRHPQRTPDAFLPDLVTPRAKRIEAGPAELTVSNPEKDPCIEPSASRNFFVTDLELAKRSGTSGTSALKRSQLMPISPRGQQPTGAEKLISRTRTPLGPARAQASEGDGVNGFDSDVRLLNRDPSLFNNSDRDHLHAQHYRHVAAIKAGPKPTVAPVGENRVVQAPDDVENFFFSLANRKGKFSDAALAELRRVRRAQQIFFQAKKEAIERLLEDQSHVATPVVKLLSQVRRSISSNALKKDVAERLDVYFDHLDRLERYCQTRFLFPNDKALLKEFISCVRSDVGTKDACLGKEGFVKAWRHYKQLFGYESLLEVHTVEMLKLLSSMYGVERDQFQNWLQKKLCRYEPRDFDSLFRREDERSSGGRRRIFLTIQQGRGLFPIGEGEVTSRQVYLRIITDSTIFSTEPQLITSANHRVLWDTQYALDVVDVQVPIRVQVVVDEVTCGEGMIVLASNAEGLSAHTVAVHAGGPSIPNAKLDIEILPALPKDKDLHASLHRLEHTSGQRHPLGESNATTQRSPKCGITSKPHRSPRNVREAGSASTARTFKQQSLLPDGNSLKSFSARIPKAPLYARSTEMESDNEL